MVRLRNAGDGLCAGHRLGGVLVRAHWSIFHCDSCDDFPRRRMGPSYSMMPGTYTGPPTPGSSLVHRGPGRRPHLAVRRLDWLRRELRHRLRRATTTPPSPPTP